MMNFFTSKLTGLVSRTVHDLRLRLVPVAQESRAGDDLVTGMQHSDRIAGGPGADVLVGGRGSDQFVFSPGDLVLSRGQDNGHRGLVDTVVDFHGAGTSGTGQQDLIRLEGFGAGTTLRFAGYLQGDRAAQYYKVVDPTTPGADGLILVRMADGIRKLGSADVVVVPRNTPPAFSADEFQFALDENNAPGVVVGRVPARDPDGDRLTYRIVENHDGDPATDVPFRVDGKGNIIATAPLDFESATSHSFTLRVTDAKGASDTAAITVTVNDLPEQSPRDFVVANGFGSLELHFGNAQGGSDRAEYLPGRFGSLVLGDMDRDGDLDIVFEGESGIELRLNNGSGSFGEPQSVAPGLDQATLLPGDLNNDGNLDILVLQRDGVTPLLGDGTGAFTQGERQEVSSGEFPSGALGDLNGDGNLDLLMASAEAGGLSVWLGDGRGGFARGPSLAGEHGGFALGDLDGNGVLDLVTANPSNFESTDHSISIRLGNGDGSFGSASTLTIDGPPGPLALGDLNNDGILDIVAVAGSPDFDGPSKLSLHFGDGTGKFIEGPQTEIIDYRASLMSLFLRDLDEDGDLDVGVTSATGRSAHLHTFLNDGDGNLDKASGISLMRFPGPVAVGDLDGPARLTPSGLPDPGPLVPMTAELDWM